MTGPHISSHALVQFLDRTGGNIEALRAQLQASLARAHGAARALSDADYLVRVGGMIFVVRGDTVTNVHEDDGNLARRAQPLRQSERDA